ncbi:molybdopterin-dependent oxidoreductase [Berryella wangjianweii]|uniref:Molybdopterin-dependent oxidoreductase n=1 Tax=Berryella wangjianweii TaxID=2734634 RepID=A0A6M8J814_9ACTN|nr:molybdopterin-dependent oxidoreductase [Berryella wangjianweii]NPD31875.1 molybdopterin-dependent oxidoreductase [Eggerthellaceae bacterium zg-997]QKF07529.1 molybdopterin-dependent oxidoreductase [Berryella wangjianweii]
MPSRRGFLKGVGAAGAVIGTAGAAGALSAQSWFSYADPASKADERVAYTFHQSHCGGMCPLKCTVRDGRLALIQPNDVCAPRYRNICLKGISEIQHVYSTKRVQTPLRRTGERGKGEFEACTWDEALDDIVARIKAIQSEHGKGAVMVASGSEADVPFLEGILGARGMGNAGIDVGVGNGLDPATGKGWGYAMCGNEARDWVNSKMVLTVGSNFCESSLPITLVFSEAKEAGARMVTVDPHFSTTASKSHEWVPIEPGTDAALFLGMLTHIIENDLIDHRFAARHTALPFLVNEETGELVKTGEPAMDPKTKAPAAGQTGLFMVIDADGSAKPADQVDLPALSGSVTVDGVRAVTVYDRFLKGQRNYTVAWASEITQIPAEKIAQLAEEYAKGPSALCLGWGGNDKMTNADISGHAAAMLVALTGNIGKKGASVGVHVGGTWGGYTAPLGAWALPAELAASEADIPIYDLRYKKNNVRALISVGDKLAQTMANMGKTEEWARTLDLIVSADPYFTEAAKWADYVLPLTSRFEYDEEVGRIASGYNHIVLQEKVIDPLFEARTDLWLQKELANRLGVGDALPATSRERAEVTLSTSEAPYVKELTVDKLIENRGMWPIEGIEEPRREFMDGTFPTISGRLHVYYENMLPYGQELPQWEPCVEATRDNPLRDRFPLQFANVRSRFRIHNQFADAQWIQQFYEPTIDVNPRDLEQRGLKTGDVVEVSNDRGRFKVRVHANESVRPGSARMVEAATADYTVEGNMQSVTNDATVDRAGALMCGMVIPFSDTLVQISKA